MCYRVVSIDRFELSIASVSVRCLNRLAIWTFIVRDERIELSLLVYKTSVLTDELIAHIAERVGLEPTLRLRVERFSKPRQYHYAYPSNKIELRF